MTTFTPRRAAFAAAIVAALGCTAAQAGAGPRYHLDVLAVPDATNVVVKDINEAGQMVGTFFDTDFVKHAVLWDATGWHQLAAPPGEEVHGIAYAINNHGQIAGYADTFETSPGLLWNAATPNEYTLLSNDPVVVAIPNDINDDGVIVGLKGGFQTGEKFHPFSWTAQGGLVDYGTPDNDDTARNAIWTGINNTGQIVGGWNYTRQIYHATRGQLGTASCSVFNEDSDGIESFVSAINEAGTGVGYADLGAPNGPVGALFKPDGTIEEIPDSQLGSDGGYANKINDAGVIVGDAHNLSTPSGFKAWVHLDGQTWDLFQQVDSTGDFVYFIDAVSINNGGVIVGTGRLPDNSIASFRLTPIRGDAIFADGFDPAGR